MNEEKQLNIIDLLSILSFYIALLNLDMNITQNDIEKQTQDIDSRVNQHLHGILNEIHLHLEDQDKKLQVIEKQLEELKNDSRRNL